LLSDLHIKVKLPIAVMTDNIGAIFMSENASTGFRTRHVDTRYHFVREFVDNGFLSRLNLSVLLKTILIYLPRMLIKNCMKNTKPIFWWIVKSLVQVD
jgi:hypothetical protein